MSKRITRRSVLLGISGALAMTTLSACGGSSDASSSTASGSSADLDTLEPGVIKVAMQPYAPYTSLEGGKLTGLDSDVLNAAAEKLGLTVEPTQTDFNGMLGGVQSSRVDVAIGGIAWSAERAKAGLFTDPAYYSPPAMAVSSSATTPTTVADLKGLDMGTVTGYVWVDSIGAIEGAKLHTYPDANGVINDLSAGRIAVGFLDPLVILEAKAKNPDLKFETAYLTPPSAAEIEATPALKYLAPYQVAFYVSPKATKLEAALSKQIDAMYADGTMAELIKKYGGDPAQFLVPTEEMSTSRQNVDRPADWTAPQATS